MKDILEEIVGWKKTEIEEYKELLSPKELHANVEKIMDNGFIQRSMQLCLSNSPYGIIAEFKRKSPSKGWIHPDIKPKDVVPHYEKNGASALSILTDEKYFGGNLEFIKDVRPMVNIPIMRKEFIIDEYQIFQARMYAADAILLIAAELKKEEVKTFTRIAHELKLEVLLELHSENELEYADIDVDMIGINNRNLGTFHTDVKNSFLMVNKLPIEKLKVSESGIDNPDTVKALRQVGFKGFLMGEYFMKASNPGKMLKEFINNLT